MKAESTKKSEKNNTSFNRCIAESLGPEHENINLDDISEEKKLLN